MTVKANTDNQEEKGITTIEMIEKVKDTEQFKTLVLNNSKQYIGGELKNVYTAFDEVVKTTLGVEKPDDVKSTQWVKENLSKLKEAKDELDSLKKKGDGSKEQEKLWQNKFDKLQEKLESKDKEILNITKKGFENNINNQLDTFLVDKNFKPSYSQDDISTLLPAKKSMITDNTRKLENGKVAVWNPVKEQFYTDTLGEPLTPVQVAALIFAPMFHEKTPGGNSQEGKNKAIIKGDIIALDMSKIKNREEFYNEFNRLIAQKGLSSHQEEHKKILKATMEHYEISKLPFS